ncbi:MAG: hypothetical protein QW382_00080 [Nitrososphaerota archaeon]
MVENVKLLRKLIRIGRYYTVTIPEQIAEKLGSFVWITLDADGTIKIEKAKTRVVEYEDD